MVRSNTEEAEAQHKQTLEIALKYQKAGRCVIPSGGNNGQSEGKAPLISWTPYQHQLPSESLIMEWAKTLAPTVWAMVTGEISGIFALDADDADAVTYMKKIGFEPHVRTRKGCHYYFRHPGYKVKNGVRLLQHLALDLRGDGGIANFCGKNQHVEYSVLKYDGLYELHQLPLELQKALSQKPSGATSAPHMPSTITSGTRNSTLTSLAGSMRRKGASEEAIEAALLAENKGKCSPPLAEDEVVRIAESVSRYSPAPDEFHLTDSGNAKRLVDLHGHDLRYCYERKKWLHWNGKAWVWDSGDVIESFLNVTSRI